MKKLITLIVVTALAALLLCSCKIGKCDFCGKEGLLSERTVFGTDIYLCSDCNG